MMTRTWKTSSCAFGFLGPFWGQLDLPEADGRFVSGARRPCSEQEQGRWAKPTKHRDKWRIRWTDQTGKRQSEVYERHKDAEKALRRHQLEVDDIRAGAQVPVVHGKTFHDLCDYWLATRAKQKRSERDDRSIIERHLRPAFGRVPLVWLDVSLIDKFKGNQAQLAPHTVPFG